MKLTPQIVWWDVSCVLLLLAACVLHPDELCDLLIFKVKVAMNCSCLVGCVEA